MNNTSKKLYAFTKNKRWVYFQTDERLVRGLHAHVHIERAPEYDIEVNGGGNMDSVDYLKSRGYLVLTFDPDEVKGVPLKHLENRAIELISEAIDDLIEEMDDE